MGLVHILDEETISGIDFGDTEVGPPQAEALEFKNEPAQAAVAGEVYQFRSLVQSESDAQLTFDLPAGPIGMAMHPQTGLIVWRPQESDIGEHQAVLRVRDGLGNTALQAFDITVAAANAAPVIMSAPLTQVAAGVAYSYQAAAADPNGDSLRFRLDGASLDRGMTIDVDTGLVEWTNPVAGDYGVTVVADDGRGGVDAQDYRLHVGANTPPVITSTPDTVAELGDPYSYTITTDDADEDNVTLSLDALSLSRGMTLPSGVLSWTPVTPDAAPVTITATDEHGATVTQRFTIRVIDGAAANAAPVVTSKAPWPAVRDRLYTYDVAASDPNDDTLTYSIDEDSELLGLSIDEQTGRLTWTATAAGTYKVEVTVSDGALETIQTFWLPVLHNAPPLFDSLPVRTIDAGDDYEYTVGLTDPNGDDISFALVNPPGDMSILKLGMESAIVTWDDAEAGVYRIEIVATDDAAGGGATSVQVYELRVVETGSNTAPQITSTPRANIQLGKTWFYQIVATDAEFNPLTYSVSGPTGMTVDDSGLVTWTPQPGDVGTAPTVTVTVDDGTDDDEQVFTVAVVAGTDNTPPRIVDEPPPFAYIAEKYQHQPIGFDADGDRLLWTLLDGPAGMTVDPDTGLIVWTPAAAQAGEHAIALQLTDPTGAGELLRYKMLVTGANLPPIFTSLPQTEVALGETFTYDADAINPDGADSDIVYSLQQASLDQGATIDAQTGEVSWTTTPQYGSLYLEVIATDGNVSAHQIVSIVVTDPASTNLAPRFTSQPDSVFALVGQQFEYDADATDANTGDTLTFSISSPTLTVSINSSTGLFQYTPSGGDVGSHQVKVTVTDDADPAKSAHQTFTLFIDDDAPTISAIANQAVDAGRYFVYDVLATDPDGDALTYELTDSPDAGMTIDARGRIVWLPDATFARQHNVTVRATDRFGATDDESFTLTVNTDTEAPTVALIASDDTVAVGTKVTFYIFALDNVGITDLLLTVGGVNVPVLPNGTATVEMNTVGEIEIELTVDDEAGNGPVSTQITVDVVDPAEIPGVPSNDVPEVTIVSPAPGGSGVITAPVDIIGTAFDPDSSTLTYTLALAPVESLDALGNGDFTVFASGSTEVETPGVLGDAVLDPTLLANGTYVLRLTADDGAGGIASVDHVIEIDGRLKLGNFRLGFTDLSLALGGIPVTVGRTYDTLNSNKQGDFGYGWQLDLSSVAIETDVEPSGREAFGVVNPFRVGTRVFVTLPDGTREGFTFVPQLLEPPLDAGLAGQVAAGILYLAGLARPAFLPDPGNTSTLALTGDGDGTVFINDRGEVLDASRMPFNPVSPSLAADYLLTTQDGAQFRMDGATGAMKRITDRNGNRLEVNASGITSRNPAGDLVAAITFERDQRGRITKVTDPNGKSIVYTYDVVTATGGGDLVSVTDRVGATTTFEYDPQISGGRPHFLTGITDARGVEVLSLNFNADGRLTGLTDASGASIPFTYTLDRGDGLYVETLKDAFNVPTDIVRDARGNVVRLVRHIPEDTANPYVVTLYEYDSLDNLTRESVPFAVPDEEDPFSWLPGTVSWRAQTTFDANRNATSITDPLGHATRFTYDAFGNVNTTTDALGNTTKTNYDASGNLTSMVDALGNKTTFTYESGNLTAVTDALGNTSFTLSYDAQGRITSIAAASGVTRFIAYDNSGNQTHLWFVWTNPDDENDHKTVVSVTTYDDDNRVTDSSQYTLDDAYETESAMLAGLAASSPDWTRSITYDVAGRTATTTDQFGRTTTNTYDARGNLIETRYESLDETGTPVDVITRIVYDDNGNEVFTTDPYVNGQSTDIRGTQTIYDSLGRVIETRRIEHLEIGLVADATYPGLFTTEVGNLGSIVTLSSDKTRYDERDQVFETENNQGLVTRYTYDDAGRETAVTVDPDNTFGLLATTSYTYDAAGRQTKVTDPLGRVTEFVYDELDRVRFTIQRGDDGPGANDLISETIYDSLGRRSAEIDALGRRTDYVYDNMNRLVAVILPEVDPANQDTTRPTYTYTYDAFGNRILIRDPEDDDHDYTGTGYSGNTLDKETVFTFDQLGRQISRTLPLGQMESMEYHEAGLHYGLLKRITDFAGRVTDYFYDAIGRLEAKKYALNTTNADASDYERTVDYTYDVLGRVLEVDDSGHGVTTTNYDAEGRLTQVVSTEGIINYAYDDEGQLVRTWTSTDSAGQNKVTETAYTHDALGRLATVTTTWRNAVDITDEVMEYNYDAAGGLDMVRHANGVVEDHTTDALGRVEDITHFDDTDSDGVLDVGETVIAQFAYQYDAAGNRVQADETIDGETRTFTWEYDGLNRLVKETLTASDLDDYVHTFTYDLASNRTQKVADSANNALDDTITYAHDANDRLTQEISTLNGTTTYGYNNAGEQTSKATGASTVNYRFDVRGRLVGIDTDADQVDEITYEYNDEGLRVSVTEGGSTTTFLFDTLNSTGYAKAIEEFEDESLVRSYTFGYRVESQWDAAAGVAHLLHDAHGSTRALLSAAAAVLETYTYTAFGDALGFNPNIAGTTWLFANDGVYDPASGLTYHLRRWRLGHRFISMDPFAGDANAPLTWHKYLYADANPILGIDPSGLYTINELLVVVSKQASLIAHRVSKLQQVTTHAYTVLVRASILANLAYAVTDPKLIFFMALAAPYQAQQIRQFSRIPTGQLKAEVARRILDIAAVAANNWAVYQRAKLRGFNVSVKPTGFIDFSNYVHPYKGTVFIRLTGSRDKDSKLADRVRLLPQPRDYTWHHHEVMGVMQLVKKDVHGGSNHRGGAFYWTITNNVKKYKA